jgi:hypothetical protein
MPDRGSSLLHLTNGHIVVYSSIEKRFSQACEDQSLDDDKPSQVVAQYIEVQHSCKGDQ